MNESYYVGNPVCKDIMVDNSRLSIKDQLTNRRDELNRRLEIMNRAIEALESNPEVCNILDLVGKANNV